jgi:putative ABC transport system ATP-binding protein
MSATVIEVENLGKDVPSGDGVLTILHEISFAVSPGEAVAVVGASSPAIRPSSVDLPEPDAPSRGSVRLDGGDLGPLSEDERAELRGRLLGFVFQSFQLLPALTALENAALPLELAGRSDAGAQAEAMLRRVGLGERLDHYPKHLSGGEQQRVALARAFAVQPKLLLADEPTGNLDAATGAEIIELMFGMNAEAGTTLVLVTHDEALARRCGRVLRLAAGRLVEG